MTIIWNGYIPFRCWTWDTRKLLLEGCGASLMLYCFSPSEYYWLLRIEHFCFLKMWICKWRNVSWFYSSNLTITQSVAVWVKLTCVIVSGRKRENEQLVKRLVLLFSVQGGYLSLRSSWITPFPQKGESCVKVVDPSLFPLNCHGLSV